MNSSSIRENMDHYKRFWTSEGKTTMSQEQSSSSTKETSNKQCDSWSLPLSHEMIVEMMGQEWTNSALTRNSACGDELEIKITIRGGRIYKFDIDGHGCSLVKEQSQLLSMAVTGKTPEEALAFRFEPDFEITRPKCFNLPYKCLEACLAPWTRSDNSAEHY